MQQEKFIVEYDFKRAKLDLINRNTGKIKDKYKCLPLMITLPLSRPLDQVGPPNQPDPSYKQTIVKSTSTRDGWLNFIPLENEQPNIITIEPNTLYINKYSYNYDIIVDVIKKGNDDVDLRFMAQNPFSLLASNMNDLNLDETVFNNIHNGQKIKFTIMGEYQFFYINYPTNNFDLNIAINVSNSKTPIFICNKKSQNCTCFDIKGNGYIKIKSKGEFVYVPVYKTIIMGNIITKYLYPEFGHLRDLFYNITLSNSLTTPVPILENLALNNPIIKVLTTTVINCRITNVVGFCPVRLWGSYEQRSGDLVQLSNSIAGCANDQIYETKSAKYRYSWGNTPPLVRSPRTPSFNQDVFLGLYFWYSTSWFLYDKILLNKIPIGRDDNDYNLSAGFYDNLTDYRWTKFGIIAGTDEATLVIFQQNTFEITITEI